MLTKKTAAVYLSSVFVAGLLAGGAAGYTLGKRKAFTPPKPQDMATHICDRLKTKLGLSPEQLDKIQPLVSEAAAELEAVHASTCERIADIFHKLNERQAEFLTPEQKKSLEELEKERQQFFRKIFKPKAAAQPPAISPPPREN